MAGRPRTPEMVAALARARQIQLERRLSLRDLEQALKAEGLLVSIKTLSVEGLAPDRLPPPAPATVKPPSSPPAGGKPSRDDDEDGAIDANGSPIEMARGMARSLSQTMATLPKDSGPYAKLSGELRQVTKLIAALEREAAGEETPEERERRLRREDGETVQAVSRYVDQAIGMALKPTADAPCGRCPTCEQPLDEASRAMLLGA